MLGRVRLGNLYIVVRLPLVLFLSFLPSVSIMPEAQGGSNLHKRIYWKETGQTSGCLSFSYYVARF